MSELVLGGSAANRIMNGHQMELYLELIGEKTPDDLSNNLAVQMGVTTEALNLRWYAKNVTMPKGHHVYYTADEIQGCFLKDQHGPIRNGQPGIRHPDIPWIVGHFDGLVVDLDHTQREGIVECKHTGAISNWLAPTDVVERNIWQALRYMNIACVEWCDFSVFYGNRQHQIHRVYAKDYTGETVLLMAGLNAMYQAVQSRAPHYSWEGSTDQKVVQLVTEKKIYTLEGIQGTNWHQDFVNAELAYLVSREAAKDHQLAEKFLKGIIPDDAKEVQGRYLNIKVNRANRKTIKVMRELDDNEIQTER